MKRHEHSTEYECLPSARPLSMRNLCALKTVSQRATPMFGKLTETVFQNICMAYILLYGMTQLLFIKKNEENNPKMEVILKLYTNFFFNNIAVVPLPLEALLYSCFPWR
jgi:hypothetical protein